MLEWEEGFVNAISPIRAGLESLHFITGGLIGGCVVGCGVLFVLHWRVSHCFALQLQSQFSR